MPVNNLAVATLHETIKAKVEFYSIIQWDSCIAHIIIIRFWYLSIATLYYTNLRFKVQANVIKVYIYPSYTIDIHE